MQTIAASAEQLRRRIKDGTHSLRQIAREARVSNSTVRRFVELGTAQVGTVGEIEAALDRLASQTGASDPFVASTDVVQ